MCVVYEGTEYHYGLVVSFNSDSPTRYYNILMSKRYIDRPYVYAGLCVDNGMQVNSSQNEKYAALCDILKKIVDGTVGIEKTYSKYYPVKPYKPFITLSKRDPILYKWFSNRMKKALTLDQYYEIRNKIAPLMDTQIIDSKNEKENNSIETIKLLQNKLSALFTFIRILPHCVPILYDCREIYIAQNTLKKEPFFNDSKIKYRRV